MWTSSNRFSVQPSRAWIHCSTPQSEGERDGYCHQNCRQSLDTGAFPTVESTSELRAPEGIRTPNLLIRSQKRPAFRLFQGIPGCREKYVSPVQNISRCPVVTRGVSRQL